MGARGRRPCGSPPRDLRGGTGAIRRPPAGRHRPDACAFRPRGQPRATGSTCGTSPSTRTRWSCLTSLAGAAIRRPIPTVGGGLMAWAARLYPCGPDRHQYARAGAARRWLDSAAAGMAVVAHARAYRWARVVVPRHRSRARVGRCGDHGAAGIARRGDRRRRPRCTDRRPTSPPTGARRWARCATWQTSRRTCSCRVTACR